MSTPTFERTAPVFAGRKIVIAIDSDNPLSTQLTMITGDGWNSIDWTDTLKTGEITHKKSGLVVKVLPPLKLNVELLTGAQSALRKALPFLPADDEAVYCGEWLDEINEALEPHKSNLQHICYECAKGKNIDYTRQPWQGPCCLCQRPIFCDRILLPTQP